MACDGFIISKHETFTCLGNSKFHKDKIMFRSGRFLRLLNASYTALPGRPVQSNTISSFLGRIRPLFNSCEKTIVPKYTHVSIGKRA